MYVCRCSRLIYSYTDAYIPKVVMCVNGMQHACDMFMQLRHINSPVRILKAGGRFVEG